MLDLSRLWRARIVLEDGSIWRATSFGADGECGGELVFNTALTGYQEILSDPSYHGQVVLMTYPLIGNYGVNAPDGESPRPQAAGFVVREASRLAANHRATETLRAWLLRHRIVALEGVDTRALTLRVRERGAMKVFMTTEPLADDVLLRKLAAVPDLVGADFVAAVTRGETFQWHEGFGEEIAPRAAFAGAPAGGRRPRIVAYDYGAKANIFRSLRETGFDVVVVPAQTPAEAALDLAPDGVFLSNGPGDPRVLGYAVDAVKALLGRVPIFGICLGHQILGAAIGADVVKLKFGHHGGNHPVLDLGTGRVEVTSQNHGFSVTPESLARVGARVTHLSLNDRTVEGMEVPDRAAFSVQYHPEAAPGPHDSLHLFRRFMDLVHRRTPAASS